MGPLERYQATNLALFAVALGHALLTWPVARTAVLFVGGALIALEAEFVGVHAGLLDHELTPQVAGVPASVVLVWPAIVYGTYRVALLVVPAGVPAAAIAAVLATAIDGLTDPNGVQEGVWRYPDHRLSRLRFRGVPWWNFVAWLGIVFLTALLPTLLGV